MEITVDELLEFAARLENAPWCTLRDKEPFRYQVTPNQIEFFPGGRKNGGRSLSRRQVDEFCRKFNHQMSFKPGDYGESFHKSYLLPIIKKLVSELNEARA
jgi:hypothetical protein